MPLAVAQRTCQNFLQGDRKERQFLLGSVRISQAHVLHWVSICIGQGEWNNGPGAVSGLGFEHR